MKTKLSLLNENDLFVFENTNTIYRYLGVAYFRQGNEVIKYYEYQSLNDDYSFGRVSQNLGANKYLEKTDKTVFLQKKQ